MTGSKLGVGFIGSGVVAKFHIDGWRGVRDADVLGVYSPNPAHAEATATRARELRVGNTRAFNSIEEMVAAPEFLSFLFQRAELDFHGPVEYRVSHGDIYYHGGRTTWTDEDLLDTGMTAKPPSLSVLV
ncbi:MAG TPA: hypothetical protein VFS76_16635 [Pyrinomonadaceae bacterium]|nr:hypothetical protein [Pyrinomonadaceae bacterium]